MNDIEQKFQAEIEVERLWLASKQGEYIFYSVSLLSIVVVYILWDDASHQRLLIWYFVLLSINLSRWLSLRYYYNHKETIINDVQRIHHILFVGSLLAGSWVGVGIFWFLDPSQSTSLIIMSIFTMCIGFGAILSWFFYLPAIMGILLPAMGTLGTILCLQNEKTSQALGLIDFVLLILGIVGSIRLAKMLNHTLLLNFENAELRKEAEHANIAKTRFLAAASHDLRQPIHALGLFFGELTERVYSLETAPVIRQVEDAIDAINSMLNALLDVSKLDAGILKPEIAPLTLSALFHRLQAEFQSITLENHNQLRIRSTKAVVNTDAAMLERMLRNLVGNALRYTENGKVLLAVRRRGNNFVIQVFDTGRGVPEDQLEEIFVEFHQLQNPARDRRQGLGLGLAIVKRLGRLLKHDVKVSSCLGRGSCFSITLPQALASPGLKPEQPISSGYVATNALSGCRVLVLDDDIAILEGMRGLLNHWGCQVYTTVSLTEAKQILVGNGHRLDLLIIDYRLPEPVSGIEVAKILQNILGYSVEILIITGDTGPERLREADTSGFQLLHKPVQPARLRKTLQYLVARQTRSDQSHPVN